MTSAADRRQQALTFLETEVWPHIPADQFGRRPDRMEEDSILGYSDPGNDFTQTDIEPA
jgi:hypothetical protein